MKRCLLAAHLALLFLQMTSGLTSFKFRQLTECRLDYPLATSAVKPRETSQKCCESPILGIFRISTPQTSNQQSMAIQEVNKHAMHKKRMEQELDAMIYLIFACLILNVG
jgi:hypothetical protein